MPPVLRSTVSITSAAEGVSGGRRSCRKRSAGPALSVLWLDPSGHRLGRCLRVTGVAALPDGTAIRAVLTAHLSVTAEAANGAGHLTLALSRSGGAAVTQGDEEWADALDAALDDLDGVPRAPTSPPTDGSHPS